MPEDHAKLSPSAADRWFTCPGSVVLSQGMPERSSEFAEEGTLAHSVAESMIQCMDVPKGATEEMLKHLAVYVGNMDELADHPYAVMHTEKKVVVTDEVWGTADGIVWRPDQHTLYVRDLKYGAGVGVEVSDNLQLKIYALATLLTMKYPAKIVNVGIAQPRYPHPDGPIRSKDYDAVDLIDFHGDLLDAIKRVRAARANGDIYLKVRAENLSAAKEWEDKYLVPSEKGCRWCLAAPSCPKVKNKAQEMAKQVFAVATTGNGEVRSYDPEELARALDFLPILEGWIKNVREFAYREAEKGHAIPSYKLVEKRADRKFKPGITDELAKALGVEPKALFGPAPMLGVTEIQKLAPGKNDKERAKTLEPFVTKESSGHTLVHESDKREAVRVDARAAFAETIEG